MDTIPASSPPSSRSAAGAARLLLLTSILLPTILFVLAAWQNRYEVLRETDQRVQRTIQTLQEHAAKVFETHKLVTDHVNERLRTIDWKREEDRAALHTLLVGMQEELDQVATITITDAAGRMLASSRTYPADPSVSFADRDWFQALRQKDYDRLFISRSYTGRQSGQSVFNVAMRVATASEAFEGAIAISVDRSYFERFYARAELEVDHNVFLVRRDGVFLARIPATDQNVVPDDAPLMQGLKSGAGTGIYEAESRIDGITRIIAYATVKPYPVVVGFGISKQAALAAWRRNVIAYGLVAAFTALALLAVSGLAIREQRRQRLATEGLQRATVQLQAEAVQREIMEDRLRQSQKMEAIGRLTGGVAHDFNNLLTVVTGNLDMLLRRMPEGAEQGRKFAANALEGANRAATLTHRLLAFSRQQPLEPKAIDPNKLVGGMSEMLRRTLGEQISIETVLAGGLWNVFADPNQLENAILNLAVNARDAMAGGGKLTIETANAHLDERYTALHPEIKPGQYVMLAVCDTGGGMSADTLSRAFDPFFTTKPVGQGTGLGLSQVYGFARQSNGHASIYSERDQGTTVKLYLPRARQAALEEDQREPDNEVLVSGNGETILVVEDEAIVRQLSVSVLRAAGYQILEAAEGPQALELLRANPGIDLLFTDVVLTGPMNGRKLADAALELRPDLKVLFTTGYTRNAIIHHGRLDEDVNLLTKPFTAASLSAKVSRVLAGSDRPVNSSAI